MDEQHKTGENTNADRPMGRLTYTDLRGVDDLFTSLSPDAWGTPRAPFSIDLARLSAELASGVYSLDIHPWMAAGWGDCTFVIEDRIVPLDVDGDSRISTIEERWQLRRARKLIQGVSPARDLLRAIRQLMVTDLGKGVVMTLPMGEASPDAAAKAVVAISFIGTTQKYFDWFSNFKFQQDEGMHHGFLELARRFDAQATRILLPALAAALGEETFTLADAIVEAAKPDSRVTLWLSGHSQGGAIVQTYTHLLMSRGVPASAMRGYTFGAPTVAAVEGDELPEDHVIPANYPIYNIISADDLVPRVGGQVRLGVDRIYHPDNAFRKKHYRVEDAMQPAFQRALYAQEDVCCTDEALAWVIALLRLMRSHETDDEGESMFAELVPFASVLRRLSLSRAEVIDFAEDKMVAQYRALCGTMPDETLIERYTQAMLSLIEQFGVKTFSAAVGKAVYAPHRMRPDKKEEAFEPPYIGIARRHLTSCDEGIWLPEGPPRCVDKDGKILMPTPRRAAIGAPALEAPKAMLPDAAQSGVDLPKEETE